MSIKSIIVDASRSTSFSTNRPLPDQERHLYADLDIREFNVAEQRPFSTDAAAFVFMNDLSYTKELILENFGFGVPTVGFYEGINDDWNLDRTMARLPYRSLDYLLLPGVYQSGFYQDRKVHVVGLPNVRSRIARPYIKPVNERAIINVNFTYGVLEERRNEYVESAVAACEEAGLDYIITQHPADKGDLSRYKVGTKSVYDLLEEGSVLISRFSTTILEALAMGRPAIYHNPIGERVPKFKAPLGAFSVTDSQSSLAAALLREQMFVKSGGDVRKRAAMFLHFHCNTGSDIDPDVLAARAIAGVVTMHDARCDFKRSRISSSSPSGCVAESARLKDAPNLDLASFAADLLLNPQSAQTWLKEKAGMISDALAALPEGSEVREHFLRVKEFIETP